MDFSLYTPPYPPNIRGVSADAVCTHRESDENYQKVVLKFNDRWRLIVCQNDIQWIVQRRESLFGWLGMMRGFAASRGLTSIEQALEEIGKDTERDEIMIKRLGISSAEYMALMEIEDGLPVTDMNFMFNSMITEMEQ